MGALLKQQISDHFNMDGAESVFIERQLETVRTKVYEVLYANMQARTLIPVSNEDDPGAETIRIDAYDSFGVAKIIASYAKDFPRADVKAFEMRAVIKSLGDSYGYNIQEARAAAFANRPLDQRKANSAVRAMAQLLERIALLGDVPNNLTGLFNIPNAQLYAVPNAAAGTPNGGLATNWINKTPDEIIKDLNALVKIIRVNSKDVEQADTLCLPIAQHQLISTTARSTVSDTTILAFFLGNQPSTGGIKQVIPVYRLQGAGVNATDRFLAYRRDPDVLQLAIPQEFEQFPPQWEGMEMTVPCHMRTAGVICFRPMAVAYGDGI